jgi:hypothetical protein
MRRITAGRKRNSEGVRTTNRERLGWHRNPPRRQAATEAAPTARFSAAAFGVLPLSVRKDST